MHPRAKNKRETDRKTQLHKLYSYWLKCLCHGSMTWHPSIHPSHLSKKTNRKKEKEPPPPGSPTTQTLSPPQIHRRRPLLPLYKNASEPPFCSCRATWRRRALGDELADELGLLQRAAGALEWLGRRCHGRGLLWPAASCRGRPDGGAVGLQGWPGGFW